MITRSQARKARLATLSADTSPSTPSSARAEAVPPPATTTNTASSASTTATAELSIWCVSFMEPPTLAINEFAGTDASYLLVAPGRYLARWFSELARNYRQYPQSDPKMPLAAPVERADILLDPFQRLHFYCGSVREEIDEHYARRNARFAPPSARYSYPLPTQTEDVGRKICFYVPLELVHTDSAFLHNECFALVDRLVLCEDARMPINPRGVFFRRIRDVWRHRVSHMSLLVPFATSSLYTVAETPLHALLRSEFGAQRRARAPFAAQPPAHFVPDLTLMKRILHVRGIMHMLRGLRTYIDTSPTNSVSGYTQLFLEYTNMIQEQLRHLARDVIFVCNELPYDIKDSRILVDACLCTLATIARVFDSLDYYVRPIANELFRTFNRGELSDAEWKDILPAPADVFRFGETDAETSSTPPVKVTSEDANQVPLSVPFPDPFPYPSPTVSPLSSAASATDSPSSFSTANSTSSVKPKRTKTLPCSDTSTSSVKLKRTKTLPCRDTSTSKRAMNETGGVQEDVRDLRSVDWYAVLGVHSRASTDDIMSAYRSAAFRYHPDRNEGVTHSNFYLIQRARDVLTDPDRRYAYDFIRSMRV